MPNQRQKQSPVDSTYPKTPITDFSNYPGCSAAASALNAEETKLYALASGINKLREDLPIALGPCLDTSPKDGKPDSTLYWLTSKACRDYTQMKYDYEKNIEQFIKDRAKYEAKVKKWNEDNQLQACSGIVKCNNNIVQLSGFTLLRPATIDFLPQPNLTAFKACKEHTSARILEYQKEKAALQEFKEGLESMTSIISGWPMGPGAVNAPEFVPYTNTDPSPNKYPLFKTINPDGTFGAAYQWTVQPKSTGGRWSTEARAQAVPIVADWMKQALEAFPDIRKVKPKKDLDLDKEDIIQLYYFFDNEAAGANYINIVTSSKTLVGIDKSLTFQEKAVGNDEYPDRVKVTVTISIDKLKEFYGEKYNIGVREKLVSQIQNASRNKFNVNTMNPWRGKSPNAYLKLSSILTDYYFNEYQYGSENDHGKNTLMSLPKRLEAIDDHISNLSGLVDKLDGIIERWETYQATNLGSVRKKAADIINNAIINNQEIIVKNVTISYTVGNQEAITPAVSFSPSGDLNRFIKTTLEPTQSKEQAIEINIQAAIAETNKKVGKMKLCPPEQQGGEAWTKPISCTVTVERKFNKTKAELDIQKSQNINRPFGVECGPDIFLPIITDENDDIAKHLKEGGFVYLPGQQSIKLSDKIPEITVKTATVTACEGF